MRLVKTRDLDRERGAKVIDHSLTVATSLAGFGKDPHSMQDLARCKVIDVKAFRAMYATQILGGNEESHLRNRCERVRRRGQHRRPWILARRAGPLCDEL